MAKSLFGVAIGSAKKAAKEAEVAVMPNPRASIYQPMGLPDYEDPEQDDKPSDDQKFGEKKGDK